MSKQTRNRLLTVVGCHVLAGLATVFLYQKLGEPTGLFGLVAVLAGAFAFGVRGALLSWLTQGAINTFVMQAMLSPKVPFTYAALLGILAYLVLGVAVGNQRDLSRRLREELTRNERLRIREQETLAAIPDTMVRVAPDGSCGLQGVKTSDSLEQVIERALGRSLSSDRHATIKECIERVRSTHQEQGLTFDSPGASSHDVRFLPAADGSVLIVMQNVTEKRKLLRRVTAAENLASLGTLAAGLAHEINNPLTYVVTSISAVGQALQPDNENAKADLGAALEGCWRIRDIVRSILQTSTDEQEAVEPVHVPEVIDAALALVQSQVHHRASVIWQPTGMPFALAHRTKLVQVVTNLIVNASQAFKDDCTRTNKIRLRAFGQANHIVIEVQDNGPGMDDLVKQRALEPFFTTKDPGQGSGLGLFLSNSIIESLGGTIQLESSIGQGTTVRVKLPIADQPPDSRVTFRSPAVLSSDLPPQFRVLVVDDEPEIRRALQRILNRTCAVSTCANGAEAWGRIISGEKFDVILCDLLMPEMTGMDVFRRLAKEYPEQAERLLFITGGATSDATRAFLSKHANRVVSKPFKPAEVEAAVRTMARFPMPIPQPSIIPAART